jgi:O-methyltransferase domain
VYSVETGKTGVEKANGLPVFEYLARHPEEAFNFSQGMAGIHGVADRVTIEPGDVFQGVPTGHDAYVLSHIIHDWNEEQCLTILGHCRGAIKPDGRLLIVETVLPPGDLPHQGKVQDMVMRVAGAVWNAPRWTTRPSSAKRASVLNASYRPSRSSASSKQCRFSCAAGKHRLAAPQYRNTLVAVGPNG